MNTLVKALVSCALGLMAVNSALAGPVGPPGPLVGGTQSPSLTSNPAPAVNSPAAPIKTTTNATALPVHAVNSAANNGTMPSQMTPPATGPVDNSKLATISTTATPALPVNATALPSHAVNSTALGGNITAQVKPPAAAPVGSTNLAATAATTAPASLTNATALPVHALNSTSLNGNNAGQVTPPPTGPAVTGAAPQALAENSTALPITGTLTGPSSNDGHPGPTAATVTNPSAGPPSH